MTIGELLRQYRIRQNKKQKEFAEGVLSPSYYSKVEKDIHRISAQDLIQILVNNHISVKEFWTKLDEQGQEKQLLVENLSNQMAEAYFQENIDKLKKIRHQIATSSLDKEDKETQLLYADTFLALMTNQLKNNTDLRNQVKEKLFNMPEFNEVKLTLYCNTMRFYTIYDNIVISQHLINKLGNSNNINIQKSLVSICINMLIILIENDELTQSQFYLDTLTGKLDNPDLFFYRAVYVFIDNFIKYKNNRDIKALAKCDTAINAFKIFQMNNYANELEKFKEKYR